MYIIQIHVEICMYIMQVHRDMYVYYTGPSRDLYTIQVDVEYVWIQVVNKIYLH